MLIERIGRDLDLDPFAAAGDDRERGELGVRHPHIVLQLRHVLFGRRLFGKRPGQHELGLEHRPGALDHAVKRCRHPSQDRMLDPALDIHDDLVGIAFEPAPIELFGRRPELDDEVVRQVLGFDLAALLVPEPDECPLVIPHKLAH